MDQERDEAVGRVEVHLDLVLFPFVLAQQAGSLGQEVLDRIDLGEFQGLCVS